LLLSLFAVKGKIMPINIAIIGSGNIADDQLAPALKQVRGAQLFSVLSRDKYKALAFAKRHDVVSPQPVYTDLGALVANTEIDAVIIATPDKLHAQQAIAAAKAGKHVLTEKPMATDLESAIEMVAACREANVKLGVAYHLRWHAAHRRIFDVLRSGEIGTLRHMRVQYTWMAPDDHNWRASTEVGQWWSLAGTGTHCLDLIRWLMVPSCGEIESLKSIISKKVYVGPHDETAVVTMRFESGATAEFCSSVLIDAPSRLEIYGSDGYAVCEGTLGRHNEGTSSTHKGVLQFTPVNPYVAEIQDFVDAIRQKRSPEVSGDEGLRNVELLLAVTEKALH
jgi:1,5-anhydro-D-fructose reductase (1,5-anhydro-D-mannitol-forming)